MERTVAIIQNLETASALLDPMRIRIMERLTKNPASAKQLGDDLRLPRQKTNYHLRELERVGLVELSRSAGSATAPALRQSKTGSLSTT